MVTIEEVLESEPVRMHTVPGFDTAAFPYMTDIAAAAATGASRSSTSGSISSPTRTTVHQVAHLERAVTDYVGLARQLRA